MHDIGGSYNQVSIEALIEVLPHGMLEVLGATLHIEFYCHTLFYDFKVMHIPNQIKWNEMKSSPNDVMFTSHGHSSKLNGAYHR